MLENSHCSQLPGSEKLVPLSALISSTHLTYSANKCIDGATHGLQHLCNSKKEAHPWLALDYGKQAKVSVEKVVLFNRKDGSWARTKNVQIRLSNELPSTGKKVFSGGEVLGSFKGPATRGEQVEIHSGPGWEQKTGRYLIIQMNFGKAPNYLNLQEVYAFGISDTAPSTGQLLDRKSPLCDHQSANK